MKFEVNSKDLNNAVKRASAIYNKSNTSTAEYVFFVARDDKLTVVCRAYSTVPKIVSINVDAEIISNGLSMVKYSDLKKAMNISGELFVKSENCKLTFSNGKKKTRINEEDYNIFDLSNIKTDIDDDDIIDKVVFKESDIIDKLCKALIFTKNDMRNETLKNIHINISGGYIDAVDGYRFIHENIGTNGKTDFLIDGEVARELKKIGDAKSDNDCILKCNNKNVAFCGSDYVYLTSVANRAIIKIPELIEPEKSFDVNLHKEDIEDIIHDYSKNKQTEGKPYFMILFINNDNIKSYMKIDDCETCDYIHCDGNAEEKSMIAINPKYLYDAIHVMPEEFNMIGFGNKKIMYCISPECFVGTLPVNVYDEDFEKAMDFVEDIAS